MEPSAEPLGRLLIATAYSTKRNRIKGTKTETTKTIPVHPTLAAMLAEWRLSGWGAMVGREAQSTDLILPLPPATVVARTKRKGEPFRGYDYSSRRWREVDCRCSAGAIARCTTPRARSSRSRSMMEPIPTSFATG